MDWRSRFRKNLRSYSNLRPCFPKHAWSFAIVYSKRIDIWQISSGKQKHTIFNCVSTFRLYPFHWLISRVSDLKPKLILCDLRDGPQLCTIGWQTSTGPGIKIWAKNMQSMDNCRCKVRVNTYIQKVKMSADFAFQSKKICGKSA